MKKRLSLIAILSTLTTSVMADPVDWVLSSDAVLDGTVNAATDITLAGKIHSNQFYFTDPLTPETWHAIGNIEAESITEIGSGTSPRIKFTLGDSAQTSYYLGAKIDINQYKGVWYDANGGSGDFLLQPATPPPALPGNELTISSASASTEGYGATYYGAAKAIDGVLSFNADGTRNDYTVWYSATNDMTPWLTLDMGSAIQASHYQWARGDCNPGTTTGEMNWVPATWTVEGSNDNASWTTIDTVATDQSANYPKESCAQFGDLESIDSPNAYRYYKFSFIAAPTTSQNQFGVAIGEIKLLN